MNLEIAGIRIQISSAKTELPDTPYMQLVSEMFSPDDELIPDISIDYVGKESASDLPFSSGDIRYKISGSVYSVKTASSCIVCDATNKSTRISIHNSEFLFMADRLVMEAVKFALSFEVNRRGGLICHGAGLKSADDHGVLISAVSGTGKTTTARLMKPFANILNDECCAILPDANGSTWHLFSTPFTAHEKLLDCTKDSAKLSAIFLLCQSDKTKAADLPTKDKLFRLMEAVQIFPADDALFQSSFDACENLVRQVPVWELFSDMNTGLLKEILFCQQAKP